MPDENKVYYPDRSPSSNKNQSPLRNGLPFGAVMATAGAAQLSPFSGLAPLKQPLLWTSIFEIVWITVIGTLRYRREFSLPIRSWTKIGRTEEHVGVLTVPLGFAVVSTGLISLGQSVPRFIAAIFLILAWLGCAVFILRFGLSLTKKNTAVNGGWFLAPASLLATSISTTAYFSQMRSQFHDLLQVGTLVATTVGDLGYFLLVAISAISIVRHGLDTNNRVLWWISSGCGGLAAASIGRTLAMSKYFNVASIEVLRVSAAISLLIATLLAIPILLFSLKWLVSQRNVSKTPPWPPTFSTAVFALGALALGNLYHLQSATSLGKGAALMTVVFWTVTAAMRVSNAVKHLISAPAKLSK